MKAEPSSFEAVFAQLEKLGSENTRRIFAGYGAGENQFGVKLGDLRGLAKKLKTNHPLALRLWSTGNTDARMLATMIMAPERLTSAEIEEMARSLSYYRLLDELVNNVVAKSRGAEEMSAQWMDCPEELLGRAGWSLLRTRIAERGAEGLDIDALLKRIEAGILAAPKRKQEAMNYCLVTIGLQLPDFTGKCVALGERLGRFDTTPTPKGCVSSYAPEWIAAALKRKKPTTG